MTEFETNEIALWLPRESFPPQKLMEVIDAFSEFLEEIDEPYMAWF